MSSDVNVCVVSTYVVSRLLGVCECVRVCQEVLLRTCLQQVDAAVVQQVGSALG